MNDHKNSLIPNGFWAGLLISLFSLSAIGLFRISPYSAQSLFLFVTYIIVTFIIILIPGLIFSKIKRYNKQQTFEFMVGYVMGALIDLIIIVESRSLLGVI